MVMSKAVQITNDDVWYQTLLHSRNANETSAQKAGEIAKLLDSGLQHRDYTIGGGYQRDGVSRVASLTDHPHFVSQAERHKSSSAMGAEMTSTMLMQLDLIEAAGSMTKDLKQTIIEISSTADSLSHDQKGQLVGVVFNTYQLHQANTGRMSLSNTQLEMLAKNTLDAMEDLANDVVLPPSLKTPALDVIKTTDTLFKVDGLTAAIASFESNTAPARILEQAVDTLQQALSAMLGHEDLSEADRQNIENILEEIENIEDGEPMPREVLKMLDSLVNNFENVGDDLVLSNLVKTLSDNIETVREANITVKADKFGLSIEQVRSIEATMDRLEALSDEIPDGEVAMKDMLAEAVLALDTEPTSIKAIAKLERVTDALQSQNFKNLAKSMPVVADLATPIVTSSKFIQKFLIENVATKFDMPKSAIKNFVALYKDIDIQLSTSPDLSNGMKSVMAEVLTNLNQKPSSIATLSALNRLGDTIKDNNIATSLKSSVMITSEVISETVARTPNLPRPTVNEFATAYSAIKRSVHNAPSLRMATKKMVSETLKTFSDNPVSIAAAGLMDNVKKTLSQEEASPKKLETIIQSVQDKQAQVIAKVANVTPQFVEKAIDLVSSMAAVRDSIVPTKENIKESPIVQTINTVIKEISKSPVSVQGLVKATETLYGKGLKSIIPNNAEVKKTVDSAKERLNDFKDSVATVVATRINQPPSVVRENINTVLNTVKQAVQLTPDTTPKFRPKSYVEVNKPEGLDIHKIKIEEPSMFKKIIGGCGPCTAAFCGSCKGGVGATVKQVTSNVFNGLANNRLFGNRSRKLGQRSGPA